MIREPMIVLTLSRFALNIFAHLLYMIDTMTSVIYIICIHQ